MFEVIIALSVVFLRSSYSSHSVKPMLDQYDKLKSLTKYSAESKKIKQHYTGPKNWDIHDWSNLVKFKWRILYVQQIMYTFQVRIILIP